MRQLRYYFYKLRSLYAMLFASCGPAGGSDLDDHPSLAHRAESWWLKLKRIAAWFVVAAERFAAAAGAVGGDRVVDPLCERLEEGSAGFDPIALRIGSETEVLVHRSRWVVVVRDAHDDGV